MSQDIIQPGQIPDPLEHQTMWDTSLELQGNGNNDNVPIVCVQETDPQQDEYRDAERLLQRTPSFAKTVKFILPPITIEDNAPQEEEMQFFQAVEEVLRGRGYSFKDIFSSDKWTDITDDKLLRKKILRSGRGEDSRPLPGQQVTVYLMGILEDGSLVEKDPKLSFVLDEGDVIQALELGVRSMQLGEVAFLLTNGLYAFGLLGRDPDIPSDASLLYKVTLLEVRDKPSLIALTTADRITLGNLKRECGNFHFEREEYRSAMHSYSQALTILTPTTADPLSTEEEEEIREHRIKCLNNLAATQLKLHHYDDVINSCNAVLEMDKDNAKALYRKGKVLSERGNYEEAMPILKQALRLEPTTKICSNCSDLMSFSEECSNPYPAFIIHLILQHQLFPWKDIKSRTMVEMVTDILLSLTISHSFVNLPDEGASVLRKLATIFFLGWPIKAIHAELSKLVRRQKGQPEVTKSPVRTKPKAHLKLRDDLNPLIRHSTKQRVSSRMLLIGAVAVALLSLLATFILVQDT